MGAVHFSVDLALVKLLQKELSLTTFIETGTFKGDSISSVNSTFEKCFSVELSEEYFLKAKTRFSNLEHVHLEREDSANFLKKHHETFSAEAACYWLDAHWCVADQTAGELSQCSLLGELEAIAPLNQNSVIMIDDARLYLCPPPKPHEISQWPSFNTVLEKLYHCSKQHEVMVLNDVILFYPSSIKIALQNYAREASINFLTALDKSRDYDKLMVQLIEKEEMINQLAGHIKELTEKLALLSLPSIENNSCDSRNSKAKKKKSWLTFFSK